jgi:hypothetical protein
MLGIRPKEGAHLSRHLNGSIDGQSLECLKIEDTIVVFTLDAVILMNALPLTKHLFLHKCTFCQSTSREHTFALGTSFVRENVGVFTAVRELLTGRQMAKLASQ